MEQKLRSKRGFLKRIRDQEADATGEKKVKIHHERERLTHEINALIVQEEHLKRELASSGRTNQQDLRARP
jgi:hypothetical protein